MSPGELRRRTLLSGTMLMAATVGYGRRAYGACVPTVAPNYQCSGVNVTTQTINANNASVSTVAGFSVNTATGDALSISGNGAVSYTDINGSSLTAAGSAALHVESGADFGGTLGSVTVNTNGALSGIGFGIDARNYGSGAVTITANGDITATAPTSSGVYVRNNNPGTNIIITTGGTVSGGTGVFAHNVGRGAVTITANGDVTGNTNSGISGYNSSNGSTLSVTTAAHTTVIGHTYGISAAGYGSGALSVKAYGNVTGTTGSGIQASTHNTGTDFSLTTGAGTTVSGGINGIHAGAGGTGAMTITANGNVTGTGTTGDGIYAHSSSAGTNLSVTTAASTTVSGGTNGMYVRNYGTGALSITANGNITGTTGNGIYTTNDGTTLTVTVGAGATVSGNTDGINARSNGSGAFAVTVAATGTVSGTHGYGIQVRSGPATVTVAGTVNGAIGFDQSTAFANNLDLVTGAVINGNVLGGPGIDTLGLSGTGSSSFNVAQLLSFEAGQKTGSGSWTLTGTNAGITTFSVGGGTLLVNGSLSNAAFTVSGGTLGGIGTVGNTLVSGATFAPGSGTPGSSMTVNGTLQLNAASTFAVNLNPTTSSFANVSGTATLGGATVSASFAPGSYIAKQYTLLTAGTRSDSFGALVNTNLPANLTDTLSYDTTHAYLNLGLAFQAPGAGGLSGNQNNVANALTNFFNSTGGIPAAFTMLTANGLSQASGESATGSQETTFNAMNQFMGIMTDPFIDGRSDGVSAGGTAATGYASTQKPAARDAYAMFTKAPAPIVPFEQRWSVWGAGFGGSQSTDGNAAVGSSNTTSSIAGTAVGADYRFSPFTIAGFALAGGGTSFSVVGSGSGRSDLFQAGAFIRHDAGAAYITGALAYGWQDIVTNRTVGADQLRAEFNANAFSGRVEGGYRLVAPWVGGIGITPYAAAQFTTFDLPAYAESAVAGAGAFALSYGAKSVTDPRSELGFRTDKSFAMSDGILTLRGRLAWAHDYDPNRSIGATFQTLPGASFVVNGAAQASDSALVTASVEKKWLNGWSAAATFEGEFSEVTASYAGKGVVRYSW